jgi:hypothetical protein
VKTDYDTENQTFEIQKPKPNRTTEKTEISVRFGTVRFDFRFMVKKCPPLVSGKADRAEGLPRLRDTDTSLITFREKQLSLAQTSLLPTKKSRYSKQEERRRSFTTQRGCVFWPRRPQKAHATRQSDPAGSGLDAGRGQQHPRYRRHLRRGST